MTDDPLAAVLVQMTPEQLLDVADSLDPADIELIERSLAEIARAGWRSSPSAMAHQLTNGKVRRFAYTELLSQKFVDAVEGRSTRQIWNLPARYGKSFIGSKWGPTWALDRAPAEPLILASYGDDLARENAVFVRDALVEYRDVLSCTLRPDRRRMDRFVTDQGGGIIAAGIGSALTGFGGRGLVIDDPFKNWQEAHSEARRQLVWDWYRAVARTRLEGDDAWVIVVMCMTGDTPVLMADGTEKLLRDIRPGDRVATYEKGRLNSAVVRNWANQGPDFVYAIRMKSGVIVRANARHPFLTIEEGEEVWRRTADLRPGDVIVRATRPEGVSSASPAPRRGATGPRDARACACLTTAKRDGLRVTGHHPPTRTLGGVFGSKGATESPPRNTTDSLQGKGVDVRSVAGCRKKSIDRSTGPTSSASITTTTQGLCAACSATTAISSSHEDTRQPSFAPPLRTWSIGQDEVESILLDGYEDVFDIEVDRTENFIANGLTAHNTRWHEDDLTGKLLDAAENDDGEDWELVRLPALADDLDDPIGRAVGEPLEPEMFSLVSVLDRARSLGSYLASGLEQQRPSPEEGTDIMRAWWQWYDALPPTFDDELSSWDMKLKDKDSGDFVVGQWWGRTGSDFWLGDQMRGRFNFATTKAAIVLMKVRHPTIGRHVIENTGNGPEVMAELRRPQPDYVVSDEVRGSLGITDAEAPSVEAWFHRGMTGLLAENPKGDKRARMRAQTPMIESRHVHVPYAGGVGELLVNEAAAFPNGAHDDMVDAMSQGLKRLAVGTGSVERIVGTIQTPKPGVRSAGVGAVRVGNPRRGAPRRR